MEQIDILIIGAGLSGIGAAVHLQRECPDQRVCILESRDQLGGTWDLFRYPGIRSDSDMHTLGYAFRPWTGARAIADGAAILDYVRATASDGGIDAHIRFNHRVTRADWDTTRHRWSVNAQRPDGSEATFDAAYVFFCTGYYRYDKTYEPHFEGRGSFKGDIIHPQFWPSEYDYSGKQIVVIGSGVSPMQRSRKRTCNGDMDVGLF